MSKKPLICVPAPHIKTRIKQALLDYKKTWESDPLVFEELCFCLLTPQSSAKQAMKTINALKQNNLLHTGNSSQKEPFVKNVRFFRTKSKRLVQAQEQFPQHKIKKILCENGLQEDVLKCREFLHETVNGYGLKESSHFLRNIGFGENVAILDRHILKNLVKCGVIDSLPKHLSKKVYLEIEEKMRKFCRKYKISLAELDLIFWSNETGEVLK
ncbi:MAG: N-glycosylase/DNA lyase [archaeon]